MARTLARILTAVQLTRLTVAFGAVSDLWFVILLSRAGLASVGGRPAAGEAADGAGEAAAVAATSVLATAPLAALLFVGMVIAVGLFAYGAALNDVLDVRHDATFSPQRPIPAGRIGLVQAVVVTIASLIVAVLAAAWLGTWSVFVTLLVAAGLLFYNGTGKYIPAVGVLTIGLVHTAHMFIPDPDLSFTAPVWLVMTHAIGVAAAVQVLEDKRPRFDRRGIAGAVAGWLLATLVLAWIARVGGGTWPPDVPTWRALLPLATGLSFIGVVRWKTRRVSGRAAAEKVRRYGAMWQSLYGATWLLALGLTAEAIGIGLFALGGFALMTVIKEITGFSGRPLAYRAE